MFRAVFRGNLPGGLPDQLHKVGKGQPELFIVIQIIAGLFPGHRDGFLSVVAHM